MGNLKISKNNFEYYTSYKKGKPSFGKIKLRKEENKITYPNISKSYKILNWKPKISFVAGLNKTMRFYNWKKNNESSNFSRRFGN